MDVFFLILIIVSIIAPFFPIYLIWQMDKLPKNRPANFVNQTGKKVVVLAGDSITHGQVGENYVAILENRLDREEIVFVNAGINGQLAWNLLQRTDEIVNCKPDFVTILIGTNDAAAATSKKEARGYVERMNLPQMPDNMWYRESLQEIVTRIQSTTSANIALISIPPIGEVMSHPAFRISSEYIKSIQEVANVTGVSYLPLHEKMLYILKERPGQPSYPFEKAKIGMVKACFKHYFMRKDWNTIGHETGFQLHTDYLHLNTVGASMVADLIEEFINSYFI